MIAAMTQDPPRKPWYREPWVWFILTPPAFAVVGGIVMTVIAVRTSDGLVADDYYKQGLGINRQIARDEKARDLGIAATVQFNEERSRVRLMLVAPSDPPAVTLRMVHPTRAGEDQAIDLRRMARGLYEGTMNAPRSERWRVRLEDPEGRWRVSGEWSGKTPQLTLGAGPRQ